MSDFLWYDRLLVLFFSGLFLSLWLTPLATKVACRLEAVDRPGGRRLHSGEIPRSGGLAMFVGIEAPLLFLFPVDRILAGFLAGAAVAAVTGLVDDARRISPVAKFLGEVVAAAVFIAVSGCTLESLGDFLGLGEVRPGVLSPLVTVFCMVGVMNAFNLSDGLDGLAGGIALLGCAFFGVFAFLGEDATSMAIVAAMAGSLLGFLRYNTHPATIFMGDTGSLLLGYSVSALAVILAREDGAGVPASPVAVAAVVALPIMDTLLVMARRARRGENPFRPDRTHLHHRLMDLGIPHAAVVAVLYVVTAAFGFQAWLLRGEREPVQFMAVLLLGAVVYLSLYAARAAGFRFGAGGAPKGPVPGNGNRLHRAVAHFLGKTVRPAAWTIGAGLLVPFLAVREVSKEAGVLALAACTLIAILFPWQGGGKRAALSYGLTYIGCVCLLAVFQSQPAAAWVSPYLAALSLAAVLWVILKMRYRGHKEVVRFSTFEVLLVCGFFVLSAVLPPALPPAFEVPRTLLAASLEGVAFLLAMKIFIRHRPRRNLAVACALLGALLFLGMKGLFGAKPAAALPPWRINWERGGPGPTALPAKTKGASVFAAFSAGRGFQVLSFPGSSGDFAIPSGSAGAVHRRLVRADRRTR